MNHDTNLIGLKILCFKVFLESDLSYILQGVLISEEQRRITATVTGLTVLIDCCADTVLIVACCAIPVAPSSYCSHLTPAQLLQPVMSNYQVH